MASRVATYAYMQDGTNRFLAAFGPAEYHSAADYLKVVGAPLFASSIGAEDDFRNLGGVRIDQRSLDSDPDAERMYHAPRRAMLAAYLEPLDRLKLDGYVYPAIQMPPPDETMPQDGRVSEGPHSATSWVNMIGVPAVVVPAGFYASGLPFGLEFSAGRGRTATCWRSPTRGSRRRTCGSRRRSWSRACLPVTPARESRARAVSAPGLTDGCRIEGSAPRGARPQFLPDQTSSTNQIHDRKRTGPAPATPSPPHMLCLASLAPVRLTLWQSPFPATGWFVPMVTWAAIAGESSAKRPCWNWSTHRQQAAE